MMARCRRSLTTFRAHGVEMMPLSRLAVHCFSVRVLAPIALSAVLTLGMLSAQTSVTTWHYNNSRLGADTTEVLLTPSNVNKSSFGKLFTQPVDGQIVGHPLYLPGLTIPGSGVHNVVYVATMNDTVYAFDAESATSPALWTTSLLTYSPAGATSVPVAVKGCASTVGWTTTGVISTPVIDPATNTMYLVAETYENSKVFHRIHALDVTTGVEKAGWPVTITASFAYNNVLYPFVDTHQMNRPGLLLNGGYLYIGFGSASCDGQDQGWVMSYNVSSQQQTGAFDVEPANNFGSVWQKGAGLSADPEGNVYADTGEGGTVNGIDFASSVFKLSQIGDSLEVTDWFIPWNYQYLSNNDLDINNAVIILPDQPGSVPHEAVTLGKEGTIYVLNRDNMGQFCSSCNGKDTQIVQELQDVATMGYTPVFWNNSLYTSGSGNVQIYSLNNGLLTAGKSTIVGTMTHPVITSNGASNGILWVINGPRLAAFDAISLTKLYTSDQAANGRDKLPTTPHMASPIVADGKVFIGTLNSLAVYGLFPAMNPIAGNQQSAAAATQLPIALEAQAINPSTGTGASGLTVTWSDGGKGGTFGAATGVTDASGEVSTSYTLPKKAGAYTITATATGYGPATFIETAVPGAATALSLLSGNKQTATVGSRLPNPIVFQAHDAYQNGVPGLSMSFGDGGAGGSFSQNPITTDSNGKATLTYTTGHTAKSISIVASVTGLKTINASETVTAGPASIVDPFSGSGQTAPVSTVLPKPLVALVTDQYGNPVAGVAVQFSDGSAGGSFSQSSVVTGTNGQASTSYTTPNVEGNVTIQATASGVNGAATFTVNVN